MLIITTISTSSATYEYILIFYLYFCHASKKVKMSPGFIRHKAIKMYCEVKV
jgi:hypothetical protein